MSIKRVVIAGTGVRGLCFAKGIIERCAGYSELVALYDTNASRMKGFCELVGQPIASYTDFNTMLKEAKPTTLIICTPDYTHPDLVEMGFAAGLDIVTEKPMNTAENSFAAGSNLDHFAVFAVNLRTDLTEIPDAAGFADKSGSGGFGSNFQVPDFHNTAAFSKKCEKNTGEFRWHFKFCFDRSPLFTDRFPCGTG